MVVYIFNTNRQNNTEKNGSLHETHEHEEKKSSSDQIDLLG